MVKRGPVVRALLDTRFDLWVTPQVIRTLYLLALWGGVASLAFFGMWWYWLGTWAGWMFWVMIPATVCGHLGMLLVVRVSLELVLIRWMRASPRRDSEETRPDLRQGRKPGDLRAAYEERSPSGVHSRTGSGSGPYPRQGQAFGDRRVAPKEASPQGVDPRAAGGGLWEGPPTDYSPPRTPGDGAPRTRAPGVRDTAPRSGPEQGAEGGGLWDGKPGGGPTWP
ncbi:DUF4282 domain-containing protein [Actinocorallia sp. API 0066]|uniref:DUF4282 domain-containing protein n=1 Tax=Actinocorallia sp. API 0066 TaxID=2896846 RepID=UPI0035ABA674